MSTEQRRSRWLLEHHKELAEKIIDTVREPLLVLHEDLRVQSANRAFYDTFGVEPAATEGRMVYDLGRSQWDIPDLRRLLSEILPDNDFFEDLEVEHDFPTIGHRVMLLNARRVDHLQLILLAIEDITERRRAEREREMLVGELNHRVKNAFAVIQALATQGNGVRSAEEYRQVCSGASVRLPAPTTCCSKATGKAPSCVRSPARCSLSPGNEPKPSSSTARRSD